MEYLVVVFWSAIGSIVSLVGGLILVSNARLRRHAARWAMAFGAGGLLAAAFVGLLPEALAHYNTSKVLLFALGGFLAFFLLERLLGWFHHHHHDDAHGAKNKSHVAMVIVGDTLHNIIDGITVGAAFLVNPTVGIMTSVAIAAHEVPQEIGDFGILLGKGMRPRRVVLVNVVSAIATIIAAVLTFWLGGLAGVDPAPLMAVAAGMFIYIAASDLIPDIHERPRKEGNIQALLLLAGVLVIGSIATLIPHEHTHGSHDEHDHSNQAQHDTVHDH